MKLCCTVALLVLLAGCGTASRVVRLDTGQTDPLVFTPRSSARPVTLGHGEFEEAVSELARAARPPPLPQDAARRLFEVAARSGSFTYEARHRRFAPLQPGAHLEGPSTAPEVELTRDYLHWCERTGRPGDCLRLLTESPTVNGDGRFALALVLAKGAVLDEMLEAFKDLADPHALAAAVLWTWTTYMVLISVPEVAVSKGLAAVMTATLISYVGVETFWGLVVGFKRLMEEADRASTFTALRTAGERYGKLMGRNAARAFAMQAAVQAEAQVGLRLAAVGQVASVAVSAKIVTIALAPGAVAMATQGGQGDGDGAAGWTRHGRQRAHEARAGDTHRQVGDANRVITEGRKFVDSETGHTVHVSGDRVVVTNKNGRIVTHFENTKSNTQSRIQSGKWVPKNE